MVTACDWSCGLIDHIIHKEAACKIFSLVCRCDLSYDGTFVILKDVTVTDISGSPRVSSLSLTDAGDFGINSLWEMLTAIVTHNEEGRGPCSKRLRGALKMYF